MTHRTPLSSDGEVSLRPVSESEIPALSLLIREAMDSSLLPNYTVAELEQMKRSFTVTGLAHKLQGAEAFAAIDTGGALMGVGARVRHESRPTTSRLRILFVARHAQGKGVGRALVARLEECGRAAGDSTICLGATRTAMPFYRHLGYVVTEQPGPQPPTYLQMGKHLHAEVRPEQSGDVEQIREVILDSFQSMGGGDAEATLVDRLRCEASPCLSLVAEIGGRVGGYIALTPAVAPPDAFALRPLAVRSAERGKLLGTQLCRVGMEACQRYGARLVFLLGYEVFSRRLGFEPAAALGFTFRGEVSSALMVASPAGERLSGIDGGPLSYHPAFDDV